jgi:hypothetical protein
MRVDEYGHPLDGTNTYVWNGHRQCRQCKREYKARVKAKEL